jgi:hypothetical protein
MRSSGDFIEKMIGRRATTCLGYVALLFVLAMLAAIILPRVLSKKSDTPNSPEISK